MGCIVIDGGWSEKRQGGERSPIKSLFSLSEAHFPSKRGNASIPNIYIIHFWLERHPSILTGYNTAEGRHSSGGQQRAVHLHR